MYYFTLFIKNVKIFIILILNINVGSDSMLLSELFGESARIKILEELISNWDFFLSVDEIARMSDVSKKSVYVHMEQLDAIGILVIDYDGFKKFKLNPKDNRAIALALIESGEYLRKLDQFEKGENESNLLSISMSENTDKNLLKLNSTKLNNAMKGIPLINFLM